MRDAGDARAIHIYSDPGSSIERPAAAAIKFRDKCDSHAALWTETCKESAVRSAAEERVCEKFAETYDGARPFGTSFAGPGARPSTRINSFIRSSLRINSAGRRTDGRLRAEPVANVRRRCPAPFETVVLRYAISIRPTVTLAERRASGRN